jgi:hypothetical protein
MKPIVIYSGHVKWWWMGGECSVLMSDEEHFHV